MDTSFNQQLERFSLGHDVSIGNHLPSSSISPMMLSPIQRMRPSSNPVGFFNNRSQTSRGQHSTAIQNASSATLITTDTRAPLLQSSAQSLIAPAETLDSAINNQLNRFSIRNDASIGSQISSTIRQEAPIRQTILSSMVNSTNALGFYAPPPTHHSSSNTLSLSETLGQQLAQLSTPRESALARVAERLTTQRDTSSARYEEIKQSCAQAISSISTLGERTRPNVSARTNEHFLLSTPSYQYVEHEPWPSFFQPDSSITLRVRPSVPGHPVSFSNGSGDSTYHGQSSSGGDGHGSCVTTDGGCVTTESGSHVTTGYSW